MMTKRAAVGRTRWLSRLLPWLILLPLGLLGSALRAAPDDTFVVNNSADTPDGAVGDGACETAPGNGTCTLRAAVQEANAFANPDTIHLPAGVYALTRAGVENAGINGDLDVTGTLKLVGAGAGGTIIDASQIDDRILHVFSGTVTVSGVTLRNAQFATVGGAVFVGLNARVTLSETAVTGNSAVGSVSGGNPAVGGGIYNVGHLTVHHSTVTTNAVTVVGLQPAGGGLYNIGTLTVTDSLISGNVSAGRGGGLFTQFPSTIIGTTFSHNEAQVGGGLFSSSPTTRLVNVTFSGNRADRMGGGLYIDFGQTSLYNVTVTGNWANDEADADYSGGGIGKSGSATLTFINSLLTANFRTDWSGPLLEASDCAGTLTSAGANYVGATDSPCTIVGVTPISSGSVQLGPLASNGGPTPTHALKPGSVAMDAGEAGGCANHLGALLTSDQRGAARPMFGRHSLRCDLGAFEAAGQVFVPFVHR